MTCGTNCTCNFEPRRNRATAAPQRRFNSLHSGFALIILAGSSLCFPHQAGATELLKCCFLEWSGASYQKNVCFYSAGCELEDPEKCVEVETCRYWECDPTCALLAQNCNTVLPGSMSRECGDTIDCGDFETCTQTWREPLYPEVCPTDTIDCFSVCPNYAAPDNTVGQECCSYETQCCSTELCE